ncbi:MAG TPA: peptide synthetase [Clostridiales bacterium]|jgi:hypothetical protein|nr:peptide synthetase [Clostridiales bacterium]
MRVEDIKIRKVLTNVEEIKIDGGKEISDSKQHKRVAVCAVIENPFAGRYENSLELLSDWGAYIAPILIKKGLDAAGLKPEEIESYGKGAIVGANGELEHAAAILHPKLGKPFREAIVRGLALIPSNKKIGGMGSTLDIGLNHKDAAFIRSHFDSMEIRVQDAPMANEIVLGLVITNCGRPHPRVGGLTVDEAKFEDGLR